MGKCIVPGCDMHTDRDSREGVRFFPIPAIRYHGPPLHRMRSLLRRRAWLFIINNDDLKDEYAKTTRRICSRHFVSGKPAAPSDDRNHDWLPSLLVDDDELVRRSYAWEPAVTGNTNLAEHEVQLDSAAELTSSIIKTESPEPDFTVFAIKELKEEPMEVQLDSAAELTSSIIKTEPPESPEPAFTALSIKKTEPPEPVFNDLSIKKTELPESPEPAFNVLSIKEELKEEPVEEEEQQLGTEDCRDTRLPTPSEEDMVSLRSDDFQRMEQELHALRNENAELKKSYTKLRNQLTEADVDKLELNAELAEVKRANEEHTAKNRTLVEENIFLTNKIISCEALVKTTQEEAKNQVNKIATLEYNLDKIKRIALSIEVLEEDDDLVSFYTGLPCYQTFDTILSQVRKSVIEPRCVLAPWQCFLLTLIRLRLSLLPQDLAYRLGVSKTTASSIFERWLYHMYQSLDSYIVRHVKEGVKRFMAESFKEAFSDKVVMILHCFELFPENLKPGDSRGGSQPNAKPRDSIKYFIGMVPSGAISFVSRGWETQRSASSVLAESGLNKFLKAGDEIVTDCSLSSFESTGWCCVKVLDCGPDELQFSSQEITEHRRLSMLRGQVDKIVSLRRKYRILRGQILTQDMHRKSGHDIPQIDQIVRVCCALSNISERTA